MELRLEKIILYVQNVGRLKDFYSNIPELDTIEDDQPVWALLRAVNSYIGLHRIGDRY